MTSYRIRCFDIIFYYITLKDTMSITMNATISVVQGTAVVCSLAYSTEMCSIFKCQVSIE